MSCRSATGCITTARVRIANIGAAAAAGPFNTRSVLDPAQSVIIDHTSPAGLAAGATEIFSVVTPPGGNCYDPNCEICVTVDDTDAVAESNEANNLLCREFEG